MTTLMRVWKSFWKFVDWAAKQHAAEMSGLQKNNPGLYDSIQRGVRRIDRGGV